MEERRIQTEDPVMEERRIQTEGPVIEERSIQTEDPAMEDERFTPEGQMTEEERLKTEGPAAEKKKSSQTREGERKWKIQDVGQLLKNAAKAIFKGELLLRLNIGQYFIHVIWLFFLIAMFIWFNLGVDTTLAKVERNKLTLKELETQNASLEFRMKSINRRSTLEEMLQEMGSQLQEPENAATILKKAGTKKDKD